MTRTALDLRQERPHGGTRGRTPVVGAIALAACAIGWACASMIREPEVLSVEVGLTQVGFTGATARVTLGVHNPNGFGLDARRVEYRLAFLPYGAPESATDTIPEDRWQTLTSGSTTEDVHMPARDSTYISLDVPFEYRAAGQALTGLLQEGRLRYRFSGALTAATPVGDRRIPFSGTGTITP